ncbi:MAG: ATP-binding protein [Myxococcota bacterium]
MDPELLLNARDLQDHLVQLMQRSADELGTDNACLHLLSPDGTRLLCQAVSNGYRATRLAVGLSITEASGAHAAIRTGQIITIDHAIGDERVAQIARHRYKLQSCMYVPIVLKEQGAGVIVFSNLSPHRWTDAQRQKAMQVSAQAARALNELPEYTGPGETTRKVLDAVQDMVVVLNRQLLVVDTNVAVGRNVRGRSITIQQLLQHPTRGSALRQAFQDLLSGQMLSYEALVTFSEGDWQLTARTGPGDGELTVVVQDVTDVVRARVVVEETLRLESLGRLTGAVAHEYNNLMHIVLTNLEEIEEFGVSAQVNARLAVCQDTIRRGNLLSKQLLAFSRPTPKEMLQNFNLTQMMNRWRPLMVQALGHERSLRFDLHETGIIRFNEELLQLVVINLLLNARDATQPGEEVAVSLQAAAASSWIQLDICDAGAGMPPDVAARALDPFFTTKQGGQGVGLGLSTARQIIHAHGGRLQLNSTPNEGTMVRILLPRVHGAVPQGSVAPPLPRAAAASTVRVLVVDDEPALLRWMKRRLRRNGYPLQTADSVAAARLIVAADPSWPDVALLDLTLPDGSGLEIIDTIRALNPQIRISISTGYSDEMTLTRIRQMGLPIFMKPYGNSTLEEMLSAAAPVTTG